MLDRQVLPLAGIARLRRRLSLKSYREKEFLKRENRSARPLTERNIDMFCIVQDQQDARMRRAPNVYVAEWLQKLP